MKQKCGLLPIQKRKMYIIFFAFQFNFEMLVLMGTCFLSFHGCCRQYFNSNSKCLCFQGNVALDVARILLRSTSELQKTDIAEHALVSLHESTIRFLAQPTVHLFYINVHLAICSQYWTFSFWGKSPPKPPIVESTQKGLFFLKILYKGLIPIKKTYSIFLKKNILRPYRKFLEEKVLYGYL